MAAFLEAVIALTDEKLLVTVHGLAGDERRATAQLIAALSELDKRKLFLGQGCSSLFTYCTEVLRLSEDAAYNRSVVARAARTFPAILDRLADGDVTLTAMRLLIPAMTVANADRLLTAARHKSKRQVEELMAGFRPKPDLPIVIRKLTARRPTGGEKSAVAESAEAPLWDGCVLESPSPAAPARRAVVAPLAPERYAVQFTAARETYEKLERARDLLRHVIPSGDVAAVFDRALDALLEHLGKNKLATTTRPYRRAPAPAARHIPAAVRRQVWKRDQGRCAFVGAAGRCSERGFLELHHVMPYAEGGSATVGNIELRCRAHNAFEAEQYFGSFVLRERGPAYRRSGTARRAARQLCQARGDGATSKGIPPSPIPR